MTPDDGLSPSLNGVQPGGARIRGATYRDVVALLRPRHWVKNGFVAAPLFFTPAALDPESVIRVAIGILSFCAICSAAYVFNDYMDRDADRQHPDKRRRPLAAGTVATPMTFALLALLLGLGALVAWRLEPTFAWLAAAYFALNIGYSLGLKHIAILDVLIIALGFVLRVEAGAALINVTPSAWIVVATGLLALALALAKRRDDVVRSLGKDHRGSLDGYTKPFLDVALAVTLGALLVAYLIYTTDTTVMARLGTTHVVYTTPFVVAGILRYLQITLVEERSGLPTEVVLSDRFLIVTVLGWTATFGALIYG